MVISRPFSEYNCIDSKDYVPRDLNTGCAEFLPPSVTTKWSAILKPCHGYNSANSKSSVLGDLKNSCAVHSKMSRPSGFSFQDHLPRIALFIQKSSILVGLNSDHAVSPLCRYETTISTYMPHMKSLQSTM